MKSYIFVSIGIWGGGVMSFAGIEKNACHHEKCQRTELQYQAAQ